MRSFIHTSLSLLITPAKTPAQHDEVIYGRQLLCCSIAFFALSFWFASLFFQSQTHTWHSYHRREPANLPQATIAAPPEWAVVRERVEAKRLARRAALEKASFQRTGLQRTVSRSSQGGNLTLADIRHAVK